MILRNLVYLSLFALGLALPLSLSIASVPDYVLAEKNSKKGKKNKVKKSNEKKNSNSSNQARRGYITYRSCPHSCQSNGISKKHCRDWKEGTTCYIEDLRRPAGGPVQVGGPTVPIPDAQPPHYPEVKPPQYPEPVDPGYGTIGEREACLKQAWRHKEEPYIDIHKVRTSGGFFDSKYRVYGTIEGVCLSEAGYFESGRKRSDIPVSTSRSFKRFDFDVQIDKNDRPEIRVYTVHGKRAVVDIDPDYYRSGSNGGSIFGR